MIVRTICYLFLITINVSQVITNEAPECYIFGTRESIQGESVYYQHSLECICLPNIVGRNCNKCIDGYYNILSGNGCSDCNCDVKGSKNETCDQKTGQCYCKSGYAGLGCDRCDSYYYNIRFETDPCAPCNCNIFGSKDLQCESKQCTCLDNVEGQFCDRCKLNKYDLEKGCKDCPKCYNFVESERKNLTDLLEKVENQLNNFSNVSNDNDDQQFISELNNTMENIIILKNTKIDASPVQVSLIKKLSSQIDKLKKQIRNKLKTLTNGSREKSIQKQLKLDKKNIEETSQLLETVSKLFANVSKSQTNLTEESKFLKNLAEDARTLTTIDLQLYYNISNSTTKSCEFACKLNETFTKKQKKLKNDIIEVQNIFLDAKDNFNKLKNYSKELQNESNDTKKVSSQNKEELEKLSIPIFSNLNLIINRIANDTNIIEEELEKLEGLDKSCSIDKKKELLEEIIILQNNLNNQKTKLDDYKKRAETAVNDSNQILVSAKDAYNSLIGLNTSVMDEKAQALEILKLVPNVQAKIDDVLKEYQITSPKVDQLLKDIKKNITKLNQLENESKNISQETSKIIEELNSKKLIISDLIALLNKKEVTNNELRAEIQKLFREINQQQQHLQELQKKQDKALKEMKTHKINENRLLDEIAVMLEYITFLDFLPFSKQELDVIEQEIQKSEDMRDTINFLKNERDRLKDEIKQVILILESIPIYDRKFCDQKFEA